MSSTSHQAPAPDLLHSCFDQVLLSIECDDAEVFVARVAEAYLLALVNIGHVPMRYLESIREDVIHEVQEILKIRSYGTLSFSEFLRRLRLERQRPSSA